MKKNLCVGILKETKVGESRAPLTPADVKWLKKKGVEVEVESNSTRIFEDDEYKRSGAKVLNKFNKASVLVGIKEPLIEDLYRNKTYMLFSHTTKGQSQNMPLLRACMEKKITLIDYEKITDSYGKRLVFFGKYAGICGFIDSLHCLGKKLEWKKIKNPFRLIQPAGEYGTFKKAKEAFIKLAKHIEKKGLDKKLTPFVIGVTGHGNVSQGVQELFEFLNPIEIHPKDIRQFIKHQKGVNNRIYRIVFVREEKIRRKNRKGFYHEEYLKTPKRFESNLDKYIQYLNIFINGSYWDDRYPRMITKKMINKLSKNKDFRLKLINDIACDVEGSIELTYRTTTKDNPAFTYNPKNKKFIDGCRHDGVTVLAVDNLPTEFPRDASREFSGFIRDYVYKIAVSGLKGKKKSLLIPLEVQQAIITKSGKLTRRFSYLKKWAK